MPRTSPKTTSDPGVLLEALARGWSILPCGSNKRTILAVWKPFQTRRPTESEIIEWCALGPTAWACVTGAISNRVTLDFDGERGRDTLSRLGLEPHRQTPSGGFHVDFKHPGWSVKTLNHKSTRELGHRLPGLDIRADGGYVLFTGRTSRGEYSWLRDPEANELDTLPEAVLDFLGLLRAPRARTMVRGLTGEVRRNNERVDADILVRRALDRALSTGRNVAGFWLSCQMRDNAYSESETASTLRFYAARVGHVNTKGEPEPYREAEALASVREAYLRPAREPWLR